MTAQWAVLSPAAGEAGQPLAIIADDSQARYLFPAGGDVPGLDDIRIRELAADLGEPTDAAGWLGLAAVNIGLMGITRRGTAETIEQAEEQARAELLATPTPEPGVQPSHDWSVPQTRDERVAFQRRAMDTWAEQYPEAAAGDVDDPEANLALQHLMTPPVDPEKPHRWLPIATTETDCGFCEQPEEAAIHRG